MFSGGGGARHINMTDLPTDTTRHMAFTRMVYVLHIRLHTCSCVPCVRGYTYRGGALRLYICLRVRICYRSGTRDRKVHAQLAYSSTKRLFLWNAGSWGLA